MMRLLLIMLLMPTLAHAIPVYEPPAIIGYTAEVKTYNGWGGGVLGIFGKKKKTILVPIYAAAAPVPEPSTGALMLGGLGLVGFKVWSKRRAVR